MSKSGFYSENALRNYPFISSGDVPLLDSVIVDFGCIVGPKAEFISGEDKVYLYQLTRYDNLIKFEFRCTASGLSGRSLIFEFHIGDAEYTTRYAVDDISLGSSSAYYSASSFYGSDVLWEGYLVVGKVSDAIYSLSTVNGTAPGVILWRNVTEGILWNDVGYLLEKIINIEVGTSLLDENKSMVIEPALIQNLGSNYVENINLANKKRTTVTAPEGCSYSSEYAYDAYYVNATNFIGDIKLKEGYNCNIFVSKSDNSITISGTVGGGVGEPCSEFPLYDGEKAVNGEMFTGGPSCGETIKSINGLTGRVISVQGGLGINITAGNDNNLVVVADHSGMALCSNITTSSIGG